MSAVTCGMSLTELMEISVCNLNATFSQEEVGGGSSEGLMEKVSSTYHRGLVGL